MVLPELDSVSVVMPASHGRKWGRGWEWVRMVMCVSYALAVQVQWMDGPRSDRIPTAGPPS